MAKQKFTKKKGPKGKKARAKAKLERQWGETAISEEKPRRVGKSRLKTRTSGNYSEPKVRWASNVKEEHVKPPSSLDGGYAGVLENRSSNYNPSKASPANNVEDDTGDSSLQFSSESEPDEDGTPAIQRLLNSIQKNKQQTKPEKSRHQEGSSDEEEDKIISREEESDDDDDDGSKMDSKEDNTFAMGGKQDVEDSGDEAKRRLDLYYRRFSQDPLESNEIDQVAAGSTSKIVVNENLELQVTIPFPNRNNSANAFGSDTDFMTLKQYSEETFGANRQILQERWRNLNKKMFKESQIPIYPLLANYMDLLVTAASRKQRNELHRIYQLHALNHVLMSRSRIQRHNKQKKELKDEGLEGDDHEADGSVPMEIGDSQFRDQGFTRPTVLVLLPTRGTCHDFVNELMELTGAERVGPHIERFDLEFGKPEDDDNVMEEGDEPALDPEKERRRKMVLQKKGKDWNKLFGEEVNPDDDFKIGIALNPKAAKGKKAESPPSSNIQVKLYTDFYKSDIIIASPLGLKMLFAPDEEGKEGDSDYLSSIEICLVQYADVLMMQNWDHANDVLALLNHDPEKNNDTDFSRVRNPILEGQGAYWRQLIISTDIVDPFLFSSFKRFAKSISGSAKVRRKIRPEEAALASVFVPVKQVFQRVPIPSFDKQTSGRVDYFVKNILPQIQRHKQKHTMVYIPSYFDFVALRNVFLKREIPFVSVHEYSRITETSRGRARFLQGRKPIMLLTGRSYFFQRHAIKGVHHLIFLGLPEHPQFYADQVNLITKESSDNPASDIGVSSGVATSCRALFTRFEGHALERIVGTANCRRILKSEKATFMFQS